MLRTLWCSLTAMTCAIPLAGQGLITTVAGTDWLFPANGKPARTVPLGRVTGVAFDRSGNLLVTAPDNAQVFKIDATARSQSSRATASPATPAIMAKPPLHRYASPTASPSIPPATSTSPIRTIAEFAR
jgi:hypothetical protein